MIRPGPDSGHEEVEHPARLVALRRAGSGEKNTDETRGDVVGPDVGSQRSRLNARVEKGLDRVRHPLAGLDRGDRSGLEQAAQALGHAPFRRHESRVGIHPRAQRRHGFLVAQQYRSLRQDPVEFGAVHGFGECLPRREVAIEGTDADPRLPRDRIERDRSRGAVRAGGEGGSRDLDQSSAVALGIHADPGRISHVAEGPPFLVSCCSGGTSA